LRERFTFEVEVNLKRSRSKRRDRQVFAAGGLPEDLVEAVNRTEMDPRHQRLDELVKDWIP
jgi:hypothetical protein